MCPLPLTGLSPAGPLRTPRTTLSISPLGNTPRMESRRPLSASTPSAAALPKRSTRPPRHIDRFGLSSDQSATLQSALEPPKTSVILNSETYDCFRVFPSGSYHLAPIGANHLLSNDVAFGKQASTSPGTRPAPHRAVAGLSRPSDAASQKWPAQPRGRRPAPPWQA